MKSKKHIRIGPGDVCNLGRMEKQRLMSECVDSFRFIPVVCNALSLLTAIGWCACTGYSVGAILRGHMGALSLSLLLAAIATLFLYGSVSAKSLKKSAAVIFIIVGVILVGVAVTAMMFFYGTALMTIAPTVVGIAAFLCLTIGARAMYYSRIYEALKKEDGFPYFFESYGQAASEIYHEYEKKMLEQNMNMPSDWKPWEAFSDDEDGDEDDEKYDIFGKSGSGTDLPNEKLG
ncbi:MAG: hypothetical protein GX851_08225 [Clostridiales bacterium]|nr:hypothetical protein [Clostridiales bacterium]